MVHKKPRLLLNIGATLPYPSGSQVVEDVEAEAPLGGGTTHS